MSQNPRPWINMGPAPQWLNVKKIEEHYEKQTGGAVKFIGQLTCKTNRGWTERPRSVFWQEKPPRPEYSNYFGLVVDEHNTVYISDGSSVAEGTWNGMMDRATGEVIFSRYRHDMRGFDSPDADKEAFVDGGRDYGRYGYGKEMPMSVTLRVIGPRMEIVDSKTLEPVLTDEEIEKALKA